MANEVKVDVKLVSDKMPQLLEGMRKLRNREVIAGYPALKNKPRTDGEVITNATLAYIQNKGSPARNIPARPFMLPGVERRREKITAYMEKAALAALEARPDRVENMLESAGQQARDGIKEQIVKGPFEDIKDATKAARKRAGFKGEKPLIWTGQMLRAVDYAVRPRSRRS